MTCFTDADCDDQKLQRPRALRAAQPRRGRARLCYGSPVVCPVNQVCSEGRGCVGAGSLLEIAPLPGPRQ